MKENLEKVSDKAGLPPGSLVHVGQVKDGPIHVFTMDYDESGCEEWESVAGMEKNLPVQGKKVRWVHLDGVYQPEAVRLIGEMHGIHALTLEDILNTEHRPKFDETDAGLFLVTKKPVLNGEGFISFESISILLGDFGVLSFASTDEDPFLPIRTRIRNGMGKVRKRGRDYLFYALLDAVIDSYFIVIDQLQEEILRFEEEALHNARSESLLRLQNLQRNLLHLRQVVRPMRDMVAALCRIDDPLVDDSTKKYFEDVLDHIVAISANTDHLTEKLSSLFDLYVSMMNNRMNQVVQLLTVFAAIFMPLTFMAGIYGMNFKYMPELDHRYGYFITLFLMIVVAVSLMIFFRWKKWL